MAHTFTQASFEKEGYHYYRAQAGDLCAVICGGYSVMHGILFAWSLTRDDTLVAQGTNGSIGEAITSINAAQGEDV